MAASRRNARVHKPSLQERVFDIGQATSRHARRVTAVVAVLVLIAAGALGFEALADRPVHRIVVTGKIEHLREEALRSALAPHLESGLLRIDLDRLRRELETLPWVYSAQLRRRFPETLEVKVVEQLPIARWGQEGFLNHEARIIEVNDEQRWDSLPLISGPDGSAARLVARYQTLQERLSAYDLAPLVVTEDDFGQLRAELNTGMELVLGNREFTSRLRRFLQLWDAELRLAPRAVARVDMRYDAGAAVAFDPVTQVAAVTADTEDR